MAFRVGQAVVCVNDISQNGHWPHVVKGQIYIIRGFSVRPRSELFGVLVEGIERIWEGVDCPFLEIRFRPLTDTKQEISFTHGADPSTDGLDNRRKVGVDA